MNQFIARKTIFPFIVAVATIALIGFGFWFFQSYPPVPQQLSAVAQNQDLSLQDKGQYWLLSSKDNEAEVLIIFYPGGKVEPLGYAYNLSGLVSTSTSVAITKPLFNYAFFGIDQAQVVIENEPDYNQFYLSGHSLGGAMACFYAGNNPDQIEGLMLLASYCSNDLSQTNLAVLSLIGSNDGLLSKEQISSHRQNLNAQSKLVVVEGMNHAQFGSYGPQPPDKSATISDQDSKLKVNQIILQFIN
jgi:dienelactone hydrolase